MKRVVLIAVAVTALTVPFSAHAADDTKTYVANGVLTANVSAANAGIGGYIFPAGADPISMKVVDTNGDGIGFTVCQEIAPEETEPGCGNGNDVRQPLCSTGGFQTLNAAFVANVAVAVFIDVEDPLDSCAQSATVGTVTLRR